MKEEIKLSVEDLAFIKQSLIYTRRNFEDTAYESYEFKLQQLEKVNSVLEKVSAILKQHT